MLKRFSVYQIAFAIILSLLFWGLAVQGRTVAQESAPAETTAEATQEQLPTEAPTEVPTEIPTDVPTAIPTDVPTEIPTSEPTLEPTVEATDEVSVTEEATQEVTPTAQATVETPTATPEMPAVPSLSQLVNDDFNSGSLANWVGVAGWAFVPSEGGQALQTIFSDTPVISIYNNIFDGAVIGRFQVSSGAARLNIRQSDVGSYSVTLSADGQVDLYRAGQVVQSASVNALLPGQWYTLRLLAVAGGLRVAVDGIEVITYLDAAPLPPGMVSFGVGQAGAVVWADDLQIWVPTELLSFFATPIPTVDNSLATTQEDPMMPMALGEDAILATDLVVTSSKGDIASVVVGDGICTLSEAITIANENTLTANDCIGARASAGSPDRIVFNITDTVTYGNPPYSIAPEACPMPDITDPVHINGYTQGDPNSTTNGARRATTNQPAVILIELLGSSAYGSCLAGNSHGFRLRSGGSGSRIEGIAINRFEGDGIHILGSDNNVIVGNHIGVDAAGTVPFVNNNDDGIQILIDVANDSTGNRIGGSTPGERNIISSNDSDGIEITGPTSVNNLIYGNYIGLDRSGLVTVTDFGNTASGIYLNNAPDNVIGSSVLGTRNIISGNTKYGVEIRGATAYDNVLLNNYIGLSADGASRIGNTLDGIIIAGGASNIIGGTTAAQRNIITGNDLFGIRITANAGLCGVQNRIIGNYIGTNTSGTGLLTTGTGAAAVAGNAKGGVRVEGCASSIVGGAGTGEGNVISGNQGPDSATDVYGIYVTNNANNSQILGNFVGTDAAGTGAVPNQTGGIFLGSASTGPANVLVGGTANGERNLISGNEGVGIDIFGSGTTNNRVRGNYIGTDVNGLADLGNGGDGVRINGAPNNFVGGPDPLDINIIAGNGGDGIELTGALTEGSRIQNNWIGLNDNQAALPNNGNGVYITNSARRNQIGADPSLETDGSGNIIAFNGGAGVAVDSTGVGNSIMKNQLYQNDDMGIDIGTIGPNPNDAGDVDTGANYLQNYPELTLVTRNQGGGTLRIQGRLSSTANMAYRIDFFKNSSCDPSKYGEGQDYLGSILDISTDGSGVLTFDQTFTDPAAGFDFITFTATEKRPIGGSDKEFSTSEFSRCINRNNNPPTITPSPMSNATTPYQTPITVNFTIADVETAVGSLTLAANSSNGTLVSNATGFLFGGSGTNRTLTITPVNGQSGTTMITITVTDGGNESATTSFSLKVSAPPSFNSLQSQSTHVGIATKPIAITVADPDGNAALVTLTATSSNPVLVPNNSTNLAISPHPTLANTFQLVVTPALSGTGTAVITVTATDQDGTQFSRTFNVVVTENLNHPSFLTQVVGAKSISMNVLSTLNIPYTVTDPDQPEALGDLTVTATSSNQALVQNSAIVIGVTAGTGSRNIRFTPVNGEYGLTLITLTVADRGGLTATETFMLAVNRNIPTPVNALPVVTWKSGDFTDTTIQLGSSTRAFEITNITDNNNAISFVELVYVSSNTTLVPNNSIGDNVLLTGGNDETREVQIVPEPGQVGFTDIDIIAHDGEGGIAFKSFRLTVKANAAPTITPNPLTNVSRTNSTAFTKAITIADDFTPVASFVSGVDVTATSDNLTLIPNPTVTGTTGARTLNIDPVDGKFGTAQITVTLSEPGGGLSTTASFIVGVTVATNTGDPTISDISDQEIIVNTSMAPIGFIVADTGGGLTAAKDLTVTAESSNDTLVPDGAITIGPATPTTGDRTISLTPATDEIGTTTITVTVDDNKGRIKSDTFVLTVIELPNEAPEISAIPDQIARPNTASKGPIPFIIADDRPLADLTFTVLSSNTTLVPVGNISIGGTGADRTLTIAPIGAGVGETTISIIITDEDLSTDSTSFKLTVAPNANPEINDVVDQTTPPNVQLGPVALVLDDDITSVDSLYVVGTSSNQTLVPNQNILIGGVGANRSLYVKPATGQTGTATITLTVWDDEGGSSTDTFVLTVILAPPQLTAPKADSIVTKVRPTFTWRSIRNIRRYEIQIDDNSGFTSPQSAQPTAASYTIPASGTALGQGEIYWRVRALDANSNPVTDWSETGTFTVSILKSPRDEAFTTDPTPTFTWYAVAGTTAYTLLVDNDDDFSSPIADFCTSPTKTTCTPTSALTPGTYYWKVNINGVVSPVVWSFIMTPSIPGKPTLVSPNNGAKVTDPTPTLDWNAVAGLNMTYELLVDDAANFKTPVVSPPVSANTDYTFTSDLDEKRYYWKVRAINEYGVPGPWSSYRSFIVDAILMSSPADDAIVTNAKPTFRWGTAGSGSTYQLQVATDAGFANQVPVCAVSTKTSCTLTTALTPGVYYWRVNVNSQPSTYVWSFIYTLPAPAAPKLVNPANSAVTNDSTPTLSWMPVTGATTYEVQLARTSRFNPMIFTVAGVTNPFTTVNTLLADGRYLWRVRSVNNLGVPGRWSSARSFTVDTIPPTAPVLTTPAANATIHDSTPTLKWRSISGIRRYWVQVASDSNFNTIVVDANQVSSATYTVPNALALGAGTYYWRVRAIDPAGNLSPVSLTQSFTFN